MRAPESHAAFAAAVVCGVLVVAGLTGCATAERAPAAYGLESLALVSVHAPDEIVFHNTDLAPVGFDAGLGTEVVEMIVGDTQGDLEALFGIASIVRPDEAQHARSARDLPIATPTAAWSQVKAMPAVDVDAASAPAVLGAVARDLNVEAVAVVRHEWWMTRERLDIGTASTWGYDRCTILVVNHRGDVVWRESAVARAPARALWNSAFGLVGGAFSDEARSLARQTARLAWAELRASYKQGPNLRAPTRPAPPSTASPPAILDAPPAPLSENP